MSKFKIFSVLCLLYSVVWLSGCTFSRTPSSYPEKSSIVAGEEITVERNQNVYSIARKYGLPMQQIIALNDLKAPFQLRPGQRLVLPAKDQDSAPPPSSAPLTGIESTPLATAGKPASSDAVVATPLPPPAVSAAGTLQPPQFDKPVAKTSAPPAPTSIKPTPAPAPKAASVESKTPKASEEPAPSTPKTPPFAWPLQGSIVSRFGAQGQGQSNDGINIAASKGAPVLASAGGIVVYVGNEMKGFGNLVLIRHESGWITAYAHLDRTMVTRDTVVAAGDMIGTVGSTGGVASPQLHFEMRKDGKAVDPKSIIKG